MITRKTKTMKRRKCSKEQRGTHTILVVTIVGSWAGFLGDFVLVQSDRPKHAYLKPLSGGQARYGKAALGILQGHRYLGVPDPRRTETFASKRPHPDSENPHL